MRKVRAIQRIKRDGEIFEEGETLVVPNEEAKRLEDAGAVEKKEKNEEPTKETGAVDYSKMSGSKIVKLAIQRGVAGASKLGKEDLVKILTDQDNDVDTDEEINKDEEGKTTQEKTTEEDEEVGPNKE